MVVSKTDKVRELLIDKNYIKALHIAKEFRLGISIEDSSKLKLAYECLVHKAFYEQLGKDTAVAVTEGIQVLKALYGQKSNTDK